MLFVAAAPAALYVLLYNHCWLGSPRRRGERLLVDAGDECPCCLHPALVTGESVSAPAIPAT